MKLAVFSDLHLGIKRDDIYWHNIALEWSDWFKEKLIEENIKDIVFLGDFFHNRTSISVNTLYIANEILNKFNDFNIYFIVGNHDMFYANNPEISGVSLFKNYPNVRVFDKPETINIYDRSCTFSSWGYNPITECKSSDILFTHAEINVFQLNDAMGMCNSGLNCSKLLKKYDLVYSGHFHKVQEKVYSSGRVKYVGNPFQMDYSDENDVKGFDIIDLDDLSVKTIENYKSPTFQRINLSDLVSIKDKNDLKIINNSFYKIIIDRSITIQDSLELKILLENFNPISIDFEWKDGQNFREDLDNKEIHSIEIDNALREYINMLEIPNSKEITEYLVNIYNNLKN